jgi:hypothetical protein
VFSAISLRRKLQPLIDRQENLFLPSAGKKLLRAGTRLVTAMALPVMLWLAGLYHFPLTILHKRRILGAAMC